VSYGHERYSRGFPHGPRGAPPDDDPAGAGAAGCKPCSRLPHLRGCSEAFKQFLDAVVTPCFPDGLTVLTGKGQFRESDGQIVQETSFVLILLYPLDARTESNVKIEAIRTRYKDAFLQESVLRVDDPRAVRVGF
jgi:uncharacterized protein DUF3574